MISEEISQKQDIQHWSMLLSYYQFVHYSGLATAALPGCTSISILIWPPTLFSSRIKFRCCRYTFWTISSAHLGFFVFSCFTNLLARLQTWRALIFSRVCLSLCVCVSDWRRIQTLKSAIFRSSEAPWPWPWIGSYGIPSCISHWAVSTHQISLKSEKTFWGRTDVRTYLLTDISDPL